MNSAQRRQNSWQVAVLAAVAAVVVGAATSGYASVRRQNYRELTARSESVIAALTDLQADLVDAETGQRGYLLSGSNAYLAPYLSSGTTIRRDFSAIESLERQGAIAPGLVQRLEDLSARKMRELDSTVVLRRAGLGAQAVDILRNNSGKLLMDSVRTIVRDSVRGETSRLAQRRDDEQQSASVVLIVIVAGAVLAIAILLYLLRTLYQYDYTQRAAQREMERQLEDLEGMARARATEPARSS